MSAPSDALLICHPASPGAAVTGIAAAVAATADGGLILRYRVRATPQALLMPAPRPPGPADELWRHTCCEAFMAAGDGPGYREFNFSPSGQWAAYAFTDYRQRDAGFTVPGTPQIELQTLSDGFMLEALLPAQCLPPCASLRLGLSAVIEAADGTASYWALAHGAAQPDFHLRQSFILTLNRNTP